MGTQEDGELSTDIIKLSCEESSKEYTSYGSIEEPVAEDRMYVTVRRKKRYPYEAMFFLMAATVGFG